MLKNKVALKYACKKKLAYLSSEVLKSIRYEKIDRAKRLTKAYNCLYNFQHNSL